MADPGAPLRGTGRRWARRIGRTFFLSLGVAVAAIAGAYFYATGGRFVTTENASVRADKVAVSAFVPGTVVEVAVSENQRVRQGDLLFRIDDEPYLIALDRAEALTTGSIDAYACSTQFQAMEAIYSSVGMRMIDIPRECAERVHELYPALYPAVCPRGFNGGMVSRDVPVLAAGTALQARADLEDEVVYAALEAIYDHFDEFSQVHPSLESMSLDRAVSLDSINPYHAGAIRFFEDRGIWTATARRMQERLLQELGATR